MWWITLFSFLFITFLVGEQSRKNLYEVLPVTLSGLLIFLYILGLTCSMHIIAVFACITVCISILSLLIMDKEGRGVIACRIKEFYLSPDSIILITVLVLVSLMTSAHIATWWDDVNYWATDAKAMYYLNAFTGKYGNVAPEFGDYPPGIQLMKWCFAKLSPSEYREGLTFAGYYCMNIIYCLPILKKVKSKNFLIKLLGIICVFLLPGVCNDVWSHGACADVTMGIVYGATIIAIFDIEETDKVFYYSRIALYMSVLTLCKSVGFEWMFYSAVLLLAMTFVKADTYVQRYGSKQRVYALLTVLTAASVQLSWWCNCLINRRIAKLTSSGAHIAANGYSLPDNAMTKARLFLSGFSFYPMHTNRTIVLDLSGLWMLVIIAALIACLIIKKKLDTKEAILLIVFITLTAVIAYGIIFVGHITIFAGESQYDTADVMAISISRYAAPFTIGSLMTLIFLITDRCRERAALIGCALFILLTTDYTAAYYALSGYRVTLTTDIADREAMVDENGCIYAEAVREDSRLPGHRVLYFRDDTVIHWVKDTYINYKVAPVPTVYAGINPATMTADDISNKIKELHAEYIYIEDVSHLEEIPLVDIVKPLMAEGDTFQYETVYKVINNGLENRVNLIAK